MMPKVLTMFLCISLLFLSIPRLSTSNPVITKNPTNHAPLFVLGDSLFDPGNNFYLNVTSATRNNDSCCPYGETYFKKDTGRYSDGRVVPDFIAEFFGLPIWTAYLKPEVEHDFRNGANFASAGGGVLESTNPPTISLPEQLGHFKDVVKKLKDQAGEKEAKRLISEAVYLFSIGGNDYFVYYKSHPHATLSEKKEYVGLVTDKLTEALKEIIKIGGRKFAFQNVGSLGCLPGKIADGQCDEGINVLARLHNERLLDIFEDLQKDSPLVYSIFDYYNAIADITLHASEYGFEKGTVPCCRIRDVRCTNARNDQVCSDFSKYVWFDGAHTTEACNWQLSQEIWDGDKTKVAPINLKQLYYYTI